MPKYLITVTELPGGGPFRLERAGTNEIDLAASQFPKDTKAAWIADVTNNSRFAQFKTDINAAVTTVETA